MDKIQRFSRRQKKVRGKILDAKTRKRLSVYRSNLHIYAQIFDDKKGETLVSASDIEISGKAKKGKKTERKEKMSKTQLAFKVGELIAKKASKKRIKSVVFDRSGYRYHGRVKSLADGARKGGLNF
jgi:large subunit ribosomal protein L18